MEVTLLVAIAAGLVALIVLLTLLSRKNPGKHDIAEAPPRGQPVRRAAGFRNARRRLQGRQAQEAVEEAEGSEEEDVEEKPEFPDGKLGAKKRAKLEAKAEKKQQREALERDREERKKRDQQQQEEADKIREKERLEELAQEEAEKKAREERERHEYEEYLKMKEAFSVEAEGFEASEERQNLLQEFLDYIKTSKVVILEDLAGHFNMKTQSVIERIQELQANGTLTGVIDDRGKFIYVSREELESVAKFVKQRGRVSITELAENSNRLINLSSGVGQTTEAR